MLIKEKKELHGYWVPPKNHSDRSLSEDHDLQNKRKSVPQIGKEHPLITVSRPIVWKIDFPAWHTTASACAHCDPPEHF